MDNRESLEARKKECQENFEALDIDNCLDRDALARFRNTCTLETPDLVFKALDRSKEIDALDEQDWAEAETVDTAKAYKAYLKKWPTGLHRSTAEKEISKRSEYFRSLYLKDRGDGTFAIRWWFGIFVGVPVLFAAGIVTFLVLGLISLALPLIGLPPGIKIAGPVLIVLLFIVFKLFSNSRETLFEVVGVVVLTTVSVLILIGIGLGGWVGRFMQATELGW